MNPGSNFGCWKIVLILLCVVGFFMSIFALNIYQWATNLPINTENVGFKWRFNTDDESESTFIQTYNTTLNGKDITLEVADDPGEIKQGLSDRASMADDEGMLFFLDRSIHSFWMNRMHFALDMIWLDGGVVVYIAPNVPPPGETAGIPATRIPEAEADMVLELTAGGAERYGLKIGEMAQIKGLE